MIRWWFTVSLTGLVLAFTVTGMAVLSGQVIPARLLSYPHGDIPRATYFIHLIDIGRGLEAPYNDLAIGYCCLNWSPVLPQLVAGWSLPDGAHPGTGSCARTLRTHPDRPSDAAGHLEQRQHRLYQRHYSLVAG